MKNKSLKYITYRLFKILGKRVTTEKKHKQPNEKFNIENFKHQLRIVKIGDEYKYFRILER